MKTNNGGFAAYGTVLDHENTTRCERAAILDREARVKAWRKTLPRKRKPEHEKPGPVTIIDMRFHPQ